MSKIICLRAEESAGYMTTYRVGETPGRGSAGEFVLEIKAFPSDPGAVVDFDNGVQRYIPGHRIISWDLAPEVAAAQEEAH